MSHLHVRQTVKRFISPIAISIEAVAPNETGLPLRRGVATQPSPRSPQGNTVYADSAKALTRNSESKTFT